MTALHSTRLLQLGVLCSLPVLLAFAFASAEASASAWGNARLVVGVGSAMGLALLLAGLAGLFARGWQSWRRGEGAAAWLRWAGAALLVLPPLLCDALGLSALRGGMLAVGVVFASSSAFYAVVALWLALSLGLLWLGRKLGA